MPLEQAVVVRRRPASNRSRPAIAGPFLLDSDARREVRRAIECDERFGHASEPWTSWGILAEIEAHGSDPAAAAEAKRRAIASYLAYRRDGGENHDLEGRISLAVTQALLSRDSARADSLLQQLAARPDLPARWRPFLHALQAIVAGSRDLSDN